MRRAFAGGLLALVTWAGMAGAAEIRLKPELAERLAQIRPIYGERNSLGEDGPILVTDGGGTTLWGQPFRIIGIDGVIEAGDAERLAALIGPYDTAGPFIVVMNSPGGNFLEGVRMGEVLKQYREGNGDPYLTGVVVLAGEECMSACAVTFATSALPRDSGMSVRFVETGARLGFHMPFVPTDQQSRQTEIARAMDLTYEVMSEYMALIGNRVAPTALVQNALFYRRPEDFFLLEGGLVTRFMDFVPVAGPVGSTPLTPSGLTQRDVLNMCQYQAYSAGREFIAAEYEFWPVQAYSQFPDDTPVEELFRQTGAQRITTQGCSAEVRADGSLGVSAIGACPQDLPPGWCRSEQAAGYVGPLPPATGALLADSLGCHGGRMTRGYFRWDDGNAFLEEERPDDYRWEGAPPGAPEYTLDWSGASLPTNLTLRDAPGGERLTILDAGTAVEVEDCALSADGQGVWYRVAANGVSGWGSARYVDVPALAGWDFMVRPKGFQ